jgi:hypothetical protein
VGVPKIAIEAQFQKANASDFLLELFRVKLARVLQHSMLCFRDTHSARPVRRIKVTILAKPNYQFEKRQKELAKKNKKEEKRQKKVTDNTATDDVSQESLEVSDDIKRNSTSAFGAESR